MAKISTRPADPSQDTTVQKLQEILHEATNGVVSVQAGATYNAGNDVDSLLESTKAVIGLLNKTASRMFADLGMLTHDNMVMTVKLAECLDMLESLVEVSYDEALDHATADLMDAFAASGSADVTADGELDFDSRVSFSKSDLKPMVREAILRYVDCKIK